MTYDVLVGSTLADLINGVNVALSQGWLTAPGFTVATVVDAKGAIVTGYFQPVTYTPAPLPVPGLVVAPGESVELFEDGSSKVKPKEDKK